MRLALLAASLPLLVSGTDPVCAGKNIGFGQKADGSPVYSWSQKQWDDVWRARDQLCSQAGGKGTRSVTVGEARAQFNLRVDHCARQSCWNNLEAAIWTCFNTNAWDWKHPNGNKLLSTSSAINDYGGDCWYWIAIGERPHL
jgi:hypothetical protein